MNVKVDISKVKLETERLIIRPFLTFDLDDLYEYAKVEGVGEAAGWCHHKSKLESSRVLRRFINEKHTFALVYKENNKVIGSVGLELYNQNVIPEYDLLSGRELGYVLSKDYWDKGLMTEALKRIIEYVFDDLKLEFLSCEYYIGNNRSKRVQEKLGFKFKKIVKSKRQDGIVMDAIFNTLLKCEYDEFKLIW